MQILPEFSIDCEPLPLGSWVVRVAGELDLYTSPQLENELETLIRAEAEHVLVDLSDVPFLDSSGLGVLVAAARRLGRERFALAGLGIESRRVVEITGADRLLAIHDARAAAA
jgi:anti-sigma B factor antagonist